MRTRSWIAVVGTLAVALASLGPGRCGGTDDDGLVEPDADAQEAIAVAAAVLEMNRVAAEVANSASEADAVSLKANGCPDVSLVDSAVTIDYGAGCTPASGFLAEDMSGSVTLTLDRAGRTISGDFAALLYGDYGLDGTLSAGYARDPGLGIDFDEQMDMTFTGPGGTHAVVQDLTITVRTLFLELDGAIDYQSGGTAYLVDAASIRWDYDDLALACPLPVAGSINVQTGVMDVTLTFDSDSPATGVAHVQTSTLSGDVDVCAWWYGL